MYVNAWSRNVHHLCSVLHIASQITLSTYYRMFCSTVFIFVFNAITKCLSLFCKYWLYNLPLFFFLFNAAYRTCIISFMFDILLGKTWNVSGGTWNSFLLQSYLQRQFIAMIYVSCIWFIHSVLWRNWFGLHMYAHTIQILVCLESQSRQFLIFFLYKNNYRLLFHEPLAPRGKLLFLDWLQNRRSYWLRVRGWTSSIRYPRGFCKTRRELKMAMLWSRPWYVHLWSLPLQDQGTSICQRDLPVDVLNHHYLFYVESKERFV